MELPPRTSQSISVRAAATAPKYRYAAARAVPDRYTSLGGASELSGYSGADHGYAVLYPDPRWIS